MAKSWGDLTSAMGRVYIPFRPFFDYPNDFSFIENIMIKSTEKINPCFVLYESILNS